MALAFAAGHGGWTRFREYSNGFSMYTLSGGYGQQIDALYQAAARCDQNDFLFQHSVVGIDYAANDTGYKYEVCFWIHFFEGNPGGFGSNVRITDVSVRITGVC